VAEPSASIRAALSASVSAGMLKYTALSETIHAHPETAWEEHRAAAWVGDAMADAGFAVTPRAFGFDTAVHARFGSGSRRVGVMSEYDALPGLGHACGHNLIAATAVATASALAQVADDLDLTIELFGTPAEEGGGGKIEMLDKGAFDGLDFAMMAHPGPVDAARARPFAVAHSYISYSGVSAHAAAFPERGTNANDAFVIAQVALGLLRQQLPGDSRVHGIMTNGGQAPNAIPDLTEGRWYVRADTLAELAVLEERVNRCFEAGALATGTTLSIRPESQPYSEFQTDERGIELFEHYITSIGRQLRDPTDSPMNRASTDMGNVSRIVPSIHPYVGIDARGATNHQPAFADACVGASAEAMVHDAATALAWTVADRFSTANASLA
jgi:amidohydrolase